MNKPASVLLLIILIGALVQFNGFGSVRANVSVQSRIIYVGPGGNFTTINAAVANATSGDSIMVANGTYREQVVINKSISLLGENRSNTLIDGMGGAFVIKVISSNVTLSGFTLQNTTLTSSAWGAIWLGDFSYSVSNVTIADCKVTKSFYAVWFGNATNNTFRNNEFVDNVYDFGFFSGSSYRDFTQNVDSTNSVNGKPVYWWIKQNNRTVPSDAGMLVAVNCTNITVKDLKMGHNSASVLFVGTNSSLIENTTISNSNWGIYLLYSYDNTFRNNTLRGNTQYGIALTLSNRSQVDDNYVAGSSWNIKLVTSHQNRIIGNTVTNSTDLDGDGIMLDAGSLYNVVSNNVIRFNQRAGIDLDDQSNWNVLRGNLFEFNTASTGALEFTDGSSYNLVTENTFRQNSYGITSDYSDKYYVHVNNMIYKNNFLNNTVQVANLFAIYNLFSTWDNGAEGNYWSNLVGIDANLDGIIDAPYNVTAFNTDSYPLMQPWSQNRTFQVTVADRTFNVTMLSNSTIGGFDFNQAQAFIAFNVTGPAGAKGFCNVTIPKLLLNVTNLSEWVVTIDGNQLDVVKQENDTYTFFYFVYNFTTHQVRIRGTYAFPEFPLSALLLLTLVLTTLSVAVLRRKRIKGIDSYG